MTEPAAIALSQLRFNWPGRAEPLLDIDHLELAAGASLFLHGPSGSGKSTLLNLIAGVLDNYQGSIDVGGERLARLSARRRDQLRADRIGLLFQQFNLLPWLPPVDNVLLGCRFSASRRQRASARSGSVRDDAIRLLQALGLEETLGDNRPVNRLSIGQQQRVAAARALIGSPPLIIADEPTSALDQAHRDRFISLLLDECQRSGSSVLFVSHDRTLAPQFQRSLTLSDLNRAQPTEFPPC